MSGEETFTGLPLAQMTLAQKLCELREDRFEAIGLSQSWLDNVRVFGVLGALRYALRQRSLARAGELEGRIRDLERQIDADIAAIHADPDALSSSAQHQRSRNYVREVDEAIDRFGERPSPDELAALRLYLHTHRAQLARERAALGGAAPARRDERSAFDVLATRVLAPVLLALAPFAAWAIADRTVTRMERPSANVPVGAAARGVEATHPWVQATHALYATVFMGYEATNLGLRGGSEAQSRAALEALERRANAAIPLVERASIDLEPYDQRAAPALAAAAMLASSWSHTMREQGHRTTHCTTSRDSEGRTTEHCSDTYHCDYQQHVWTFDRARASAAMRQFESDRAALRGLEFSPVDPAPLTQLLMVSPAATGARAEAIERQHQLARDVLRAPAITLSAQLERALRPYQPAECAHSVYVWLRDHIDSTSDFPALLSVRDSRCNDRDVEEPRGLVAIRSFATPLAQAGSRLAQQREDLRVARALLEQSARVAQRLRAQPELTVADWSAVSDLATQLYLRANRDGALRPALTAQRQRWTLYSALLTALVCALIGYALYQRERTRAWRSLARRY